MEAANNVLTATTQEAIREAVRLDFIAGAELASVLGDQFKWSSHLLKLALKDNPLEGQITKNVQMLQDGTWKTALYCDENSELSIDLANTDLFQGIFDSFRTRLNGLADSETYYEEPATSTALEIGNSSLDWYLALHRVNYQLSATKGEGDAWTIHAKVTDLYNFEYWNWADADSVPQALKTAINNYGAYAFDNGLLKQYPIAIDMIDRPAIWL